jgi:hypothetical protein
MRRSVRVIVGSRRLKALIDTIGFRYDFGSIRCLSVLNMT